MMGREDFFYLTIVVTVLVIRVSVFLVPNVDVVFWGTVIHHFWFGVVLLALGVIIPKQWVRSKLVLSGIGAGLLLDQLVFMATGAGGDNAYWALPSVLGAAAIVLVIYPIKKALAEQLLKTGSYTRGF